MTLFFPDVNVWLALADGEHFHHELAMGWATALPANQCLIFARYTHLGLLRLLTNPSVMKDKTLALREAWSVYENWLSDSRVEFYPEPGGLHADFRRTTLPLDESPATKWIGDCYLLAFAKGCGATLVTFDRPLAAFAKKRGFKAMVPA